MHPSQSPECARDCAAHRRVAFAERVLRFFLPSSKFLQPETISGYLLNYGDTLRFSRTRSNQSTHVPPANAPGTGGIGMAEVFGATSTTEDVLSGINLQGKRILVTGVSAGLGIETARSLAAHGAQIVGAARDLTKAKA